ncbi:MAG: sensor histidine kinase [Ruminococcus sp.]|nr:sensor histidine kinase [Ruminococcus sp.]
MKLTEFIRDRLIAYLIYTTIWALVLVFLFAFHVPVEAIIIASVLIMLGVIAAEMWAFLRKRRFYEKLMSDLSQLDKKYLLSEMLDEPEFLDGRILHNAICEADKSMCEHIAEYRRENKNFREYIELWVHEIKLPVAGLQLMCHNDGNTRYNEQLRRIDDYIENVLYYARSESAEKDYIIKPVSLKRVFSEVAVRNREELQAHGMNLKTSELDTDVMTDGKWLSFIIGQLMSNSLKYDATEIIVKGEDFPDRTVLHFRDNGIGIPESDLPFIFDKTFTGENGRTHKKSTGMGLYIVKKLCDRLGHTVEASSVQGEFTEISIIFGKNELYKIE